MPKKKLTTRQKALAAGFRSGLEEQIAQTLNAKGVDAQYETHKVIYTVPARVARYTPDFILPNGIVIETKGRFITKDRQKHILIKGEHPDLDVRFVFSNPNSRISKGSPTTYGMWCDKHGFEYAKAHIPDAWINEPTDPRKIEALTKAGLT